MSISLKELLFFLYFVQGLPYGVQTYYLPIYFQSVLNLSVTVITLTNLLSFPWLVKFIWGPFVDRFQTKRSLLVVINSTLMVICFLSPLVLSQSLNVKLFIIFIINALTSIQDVIVDATAISLLQYNSMFLAGVMQVVAYKLGAVLAGGLGSWLVDYVGLSELILMMGVFFSLAAYASYTSQELQIQEHNELINQTARVVVSTSQEDSQTHFKRIFSSFSEPSTLWTILLLLVYKLGEQGTLKITPIYMITMGVSKEHVSWWLNIVGGTLSILGSMLGFLVMDWQNFSSKQLLSIIFHLRILPASFIMLVAIANRYTLPHEYSPSFEVSLITSHLMLALLGGIATTITCTATLQLTKLQPRMLQATHMSVFSTIEVLGKLVFISSSGFFAYLLNFPCVFVIFVIIDILTIPILQKI